MYMSFNINESHKHSQKLIWDRVADCNFNISRNIFVIGLIIMGSTLFNRLDIVTEREQSLSLAENMDTFRRFFDEDRSLKCLRSVACYSNITLAICGFSKKRSGCS